jgi:serine protease AprX
VVDEARARVRNDLGAHLADKASDDFCVAFASARPAVSFGLESAAPAVAPAAVIEFAPAPEEIRALPERITRAATDRVSEELKRAHEDAGLPEMAFALQGDLPLRQAGLKAMRDDFLKTVGRVHDELERTAAALAPTPRLETVAGPAAPLPARAVEVCWLIRAVRAVADPRALSEVVADPAVERVDLPRRIEADQIAVTADLLDVISSEARSLRDSTGLAGTGVTVGVIDSEVALAHPALSGRVIHKQNYTREPFGVTGEHGTAVAGILGGGATVAGIAPEVTIYNYKVLATNRFLNSEDFGGALAIQQALEDGVRVVNCSWGTGPAGNGTAREARACDTAWAWGLVIVKSAGNDGPGGGTLTTPADAEGVVVVGATDRAGKTVQSYSSRGPTQAGVERPHLVAPGGSVNPDGTLDKGIVTALSSGGVGDAGAGTSFAAPHVTGLVALMLEREPGLTPPQIRDRLVAACELLEDADGNTQGAGLINPATLLQ